MRLLMAGLLLAVCCGAVTADQYPIYQAPLTEAPIAVDGALDEPIWRQAPTTAPFVRYRDGTPAQFRTTGQVAYDRDALYVAFRCREPLVDPGGETGISRDDSVELFFDPQATRNRYFQWIVESDGSGIGGYDGDLSAGLPFRPAVRAARREWTMEVRIPFAAFGERPGPGDRWGMNLNRTRAARAGGDQEQLAWSRTGGGFRVPERFGYLLFGLPPGAPPLLEEPAAEIGDRILEQIRKELTGDWRWTDDDLGFEARNARARELLALGGLASRTGGDLLTYVRPAIRDEQILPWTVPALEEVGRPIEVTLCPNEFEPATFAIFALKDLAGVTVSVKPPKIQVNDPMLQGAARFVAPLQPEVFQVVRWYQAGAGSVFRGRTTLLAELLLKRNDLVRLDPATRTNVFAFEGGVPPRDADDLQPVDISAFESQQFWLTFRIPEDAAPGDYESDVEVRVAGKPAATIPLRVRVLDFLLDRSMFIYSLYYGLRLPELKTAEEERAFLAQWGSEIKDQVDHGINAPSSYICGGVLPSGKQALEALIELHRAAGVSDDAPLICVTLSVGGQRTEEQYESVRKMVRSTLDFVRARGRQTVYFQGIDEARGEKLRLERGAFQAVQEAGGKVFVACYRGYFDIIGDLLDMPVVSGALAPELPPRVHELGYRILSYGNPQSGVEKPELYRRNYGLKLYVAGYDGAMDFGYCPHGEGAWDDFDGDHYRAHAFAYPALGKPVNTIQWEGWREACDDIRYLTTLLNTMARLDGRPEAAMLIADTRAWLQTLTGEEDLDQWRRDLIERIQRLRAAE